jgi:uncharacterized membrane protein YjdF
MSIFTHKFPIISLAIYLFLLILLAIDPYDRAVWWAENIPVLINNSAGLPCNQFAARTAPLAKVILDEAL